jgi:YHS domain-containing protein
MLKQTFVLVLMLSFVSVVNLYAQESNSPAVVADGTNAAVNEVGNKICPVSGEKVGQMGDIIKIEHNGKMYNLCCAMCQKDFSKDPDKYSKIAEDEVKSSAETK